MNYSVFTEGNEGDENLTLLFPIGGTSWVRSVLITTIKFQSDEAANKIFHQM